MIRSFLHGSALQLRPFITCSSFFPSTHLERGAMMNLFFIYYTPWQIICQPYFFHEIILPAFLPFYYPGHPLFSNKIPVSAKTYGNRFQSGYNAITERLQNGISVTKAKAFLHSLLIFPRHGTQRPACRGRNARR